MKRNISGFTIIELLIVIVVIAILATISVVAYNGIQDRANDTAVQSDINNFTKKIMLYHAEHGVYPHGPSTGPVSGVGDFPLAQDAYMAGADRSNFYYCWGRVDDSGVFAVGAISKSGNGFYYTSLNGGLRPYTGSWGGAAVNCKGMLPGLEGDIGADWSRVYGYDLNTGWRSWTN